MPKENSSFIATLNDAFPLATDRKSQGDDHIRLIKDNLIGSLPNMSEAMTMSTEKLNQIDSQVAASSGALILTTGELLPQLTVTTPSVEITNDLIPLATPATVTEVGNVDYLDARMLTRINREYFKSIMVSGVSADTFGYDTTLNIGTLDPSVLGTHTILGITVTINDFKVTISGVDEPTDLVHLIVGTRIGVVSLDVNDATRTEVGGNTEFLWEDIGAGWFIDEFETDIQFIFRIVSPDKDIGCYSTREVAASLQTVNDIITERSYRHLVGTAVPVSAQGEDGDIYLLTI